jgi:nicotinate phosphoribosyltransferase
MAHLQQIYRTSLALLTDLYQLTMAQGYWKLGLAEREAVFHLTFRENPFGGGFAVAAGLESAVDYLNGLHFDQEDLELLSSLKGNDGAPLFETGFINDLRDFDFRCDVDAIPEGTVVFPHEPLVRVRGPLLQAQLVETALLTMINFSTLIATKAARVCHAAREEPVLEFGLRRAQGIDGSLSASRAAYIGGCAATSNVLAARIHGIPVKGTHAHSWVMVFDDELESFLSYAEALPNNCVFLVDTYDTAQGVRNAVKVGQELRERGFEMIGIRLDSGDLAKLSKRAREILDHGGFPDATIVASNDLDEYRISELKEQGATIAVWGVGTRLVTATDQPALGGIYKLSAIQSEGGGWEDRVKLSEQPIKISNPGVQQVRRRIDPETGAWLGDQIVDEREPATHSSESLLKPILKRGEQVMTMPDIHAIRARCIDQLSQLPSPLHALKPAAPYPVEFSADLTRRQKALISSARTRTQRL